MNTLNKKFLASLIAFCTLSALALMQADNVSDTHSEITESIEMSDTDMTSAYTEPIAAETDTDNTQDLTHIDETPTLENIVVEQDFENLPLFEEYDLTPTNDIQAPAQQPKKLAPVTTTPVTTSVVAQEEPAELMETILEATLVEEPLAEPTESMELPEATAVVEEQLVEPLTAPELEETIVLADEC